MCGINGIISSERNGQLKDLVNRMNNNILHRGPDDDGNFVYEERVALGMRRLSIIDLSSGKQPIFNNAGDLCIVFNGEIYNYQVLREALLKEGVIFKTKSDTEVVLKLYELYGTKMLERLNGMFAFAILDMKKQVVIIARDRTGEKPLYYYHDQEKFVWGSELKSLVNNFDIPRQINKVSLNLFFSLTFIPSPYTIYEAVHKLEPATFLTIDINTLAFTKTRYWDVPAKVQEDLTDYEEAKHHVKEIVYESIRQRMLADVPLGAFLSGGVDSSIVTAVMADISDRPIETFSIGFEDPNYDESSVARSVSEHLGTKHTSLILEYNKIFQELDPILRNFDEPFADSSALPTYFVSTLAKRSVKVALTGDGGDEVFGGYNRYLINSYYRKYRKLVPYPVHNYVVKPFLNQFSEPNTRSRTYRIRKLINSFGKNNLENIENIISLGYLHQELEELLLPAFRDNKLSALVSTAGNYLQTDSILKVARYVDKNISLEGDMLTKVDRTSMLNSIECRAPFLDHRLFELTNKMPDDFLIKNGVKKRILKDTFVSLVPHGLFTLPKSGFEIPIGNWLKTELKDQLNHYLSRELLEKQGIFNYAYVNKIRKAHFENKRDYSFKLWTLFCFQHWYYNNLNS